MYSIGEAAKRTGLSAHTLRFYEKIGVLPEPERRGGARRYRDRDIRYIEFVHSLKETGMSLEEIALFTESGCLLDLDPETAERGDMLIERIRLLREHADRINKQIRELEQVKAAAMDKVAYYSSLLPL